MKIYVYAPRENAFVTLLREAGATPAHDPSDIVEPVALGATGPKTVEEVKRLVAEGKKPVALGGLDRDTLAKCRDAGAVGFVFDVAFALLPGSPTPQADKDAIARLTTGDFATGEVALPSGVRVGRDALLAPFFLKRSRTIAGAIADIRADAAREAAPKAPAATPPAPVPTPAPPPQPAATPDVLAKLTQLVSERTGYSTDLLEPDLDMEADLGIDTVKQAEIFGILRDSYQLPRDDSVQLKDYATLRKVANYMTSRMGQAPAAPARELKPESPQSAQRPATPSPTTVRSVSPAVPVSASGKFETQPHEEAVAIIGMGAVLPKSNGAQAFWQNVLHKVNSITEVPADRWDSSIHYDADHSAPDKTYAKIGAFVTDFQFDSLKFRIPPTVVKALDPIQLMALAAAAEALADAGYDTKTFDRSRCAVILGNSLGGERKDETNKRMHLAEFSAELRKVLPADKIAAVEAQIKLTLPQITEDTMPGELSNVIAGRLANVLNLTGKNLTTDAACASSHAAMDTAVKAILGGEADMVLCGGADRSMDPGTYVKFSKIGALSATGSTPFDARADGFVMGEGAAILLLKRLSDAVRDGDKIYAVIRGMGSSSDGKGKGITAPNPEGQKLAVKRALETAEVSPKHIQLVEAHGTSTKVGDVVEVESIAELFKGVAPGTIALGSVKSQIGHLKSAAGAAGIMKAAFALYTKTLPPSINFQTPNPAIKWSEVPFYVNTEPQPWPNTPTGEPRRAAVSAFGFGGTNFHLILEEYVPSYHNAKPVRTASKPQIQEDFIAIGADSVEGLVAELAKGASTPNYHTHSHRFAVGASSPAELKAALATAAPLLADPKGRMALPLKVRGASYGEGPKFAGKVAFLFPGQGSQYANMCALLALKYPVVRQTFAEADAVLEPLIGKKITDLIFVRDPTDKAAIAAAEEALRQTEVTQPAMLAADVAMFRLLAQHGIHPDMVAGHSLGEYAALVAAGVLSFADALTAVSARGKEMANVHVPDKGLMASFSCGPEQAEEILRGVDGYVVAANKNCPVQTVIAGDTPSVKKAIELAKAKGVETMLLPVSAAFHTSIVAPASAPLRRVLDRLDFHAPKTLVYTNVDATPYPNDPNAIRDILSKQVAAPVEWVKELETMYANGARVFIEVGPKRALAGFTDATLGKREGVLSLLTNHPKTGDIPTYYACLAKLASVGFELTLAQADPISSSAPESRSARASENLRPSGPPDAPQGSAMARITNVVAEEFAGLEAKLAAYERFGLVPADIVVSGAAAGLPGQARSVFSDENFERLFAGENRIDKLDSKWAHKFIEKELVRLVKDSGEPRMESVTDPKDVLKLAGRKGEFNVEKDYFVPAKLVKTLDITSKLAIAAALEALYDAGIPLVREQIATTTGKTLPGDWILPAHLQDGTGIIFASAFPGYDNFVQEISRNLSRRFANKTLTELDALYHEILEAVPAEKKSRVSAFYAKHAGELHKLAGDEKGIEAFNRHFLFSVLSMGHAELAELIVARGPNTQVNAACSSSTQAIAIGEDWIRSGRAQRVLVVGADDVTSENLLEWIGSGFLVSGAATTAGNVEEGALPFDKRRHGMIIGMGAVGIVLEKREDVEARGMTPIARLVATKIANSAFHGSRLDVAHIAREAKGLVETAARRLGIPVDSLGEKTIFVSHETYTPARGGSASAEAAAMRQAFGASATKVLIANTKGFTGHPMGAGIEDALAVKALQFNKIPPIANLRDVDPEFADLNLSRGGAHDRRYAMRFSAGFGSQLAMAFFEKMTDGAQRVKDAPRYQAFLDLCSGLPGAKAERVGRVFRVTSAGLGVVPVNEADTTRPSGRVGALVVSAPIVVKEPEPVVVPVRAVPTSSDVLGKVIALVSEKSGYPPDMLDPNLDMEADLGIDTVKQAEIFGVLREQFGVPREDGLSLKAYPTLAKVAEYMASRMGARSEVSVVVPVTAPPKPTPPVAPAAPAAPAKPLVNADEILHKVLAIVSERTGYPADILDPTLQMEADLGIDTVKQAEMFAEIRETFGIPRIEGINLKDYPTISHVVGFVQTHAGRTIVPTVETAVAPGATAPASSIVRRVPRVTEAHAEGSTVRTLFVVGHGDLAEALRPKHHATTADVAVFTGTPRELFVFAKQHVADLESGKLGLLVVTHMGGEQGINERALDPAQGGLTGMAKALAAEFPKAWIRALDLDSNEDVAARVHHVEAELKIDKSLVEIGRHGKKRVAIRTIAAGSPDTRRPTLKEGSVLLVTGGARGITAEALKALAPQKPTLVLLGRTDAPTDADLTLDESALKERAKLELAAAGAKVTPVNIEKYLAPHRARNEVAKTLRDLRALGATATYLKCDVTDEKSLSEIRARYPKIDGVLHAAGVEESKKLADKDEAAFDRAWKPKAEAAFLLAKLTEKDHLQFFVMFGSVAGRFGNAAQADYSAANDAMAKLARALRARGVPASVFCWGPWGETGMATRGSTLTVLSAAGVEPITTKEGVEAFLSELARLDEPEVVLAKSLGALAAEPQGQVAHKQTLDASSPSLDHHRVGGVPYLAGVLGIQAFLDAAKTHVTGVEDVQFGYPVKLLRDESIEITVTMDSVGNAKLTSIPKGPVKQEKVHFTGAVLTAPHAAPPAREARGAVWSFVKIYPPFFHGPAFQVLSRAERVSFDGIEVAGNSAGIAPLPATLEGAFQALGLWGLAVGRKMALPERIARATFHEGYNPERTTYRVFDAKLADGRVSGNVQCVVDGQVVAALEGVALIITGDAPENLEAPSAWAHDEIALGGGNVVRVNIQESRALLERPELLATWLGPQEQAALAKFTIQKRREEWLAATLAGKTALRNAGDNRAWSSMEILRGEDGAPLAHEYRGLTLGHAAGVAVARVFDAARERAGVDVEVIEPRSAAFEEEAFTLQERARLASDPQNVTLAWCAKEAVLKALGLGLSVDLHSVQVTLLKDRAEIELSGKAKEKFVALDGSSLAVATRVEGAAMALATVTLVRRGA